MFVLKLYGIQNQYLKLEKYLKTIEFVHKFRKFITDIKYYKNWG